MLMIPRQLQHDQFRFVLVQSRDKKAIEKAWNAHANYKSDDERLQAHLENGGNYGVLTGVVHLGVVDADCKELFDWAMMNLPPTFTVKTGKGAHFYYFIPSLNKKIVLTKDKTHYGEIQFSGQFVVGPNCTHPTGSIYAVILDRDIAVLNEQDLSRLAARFKDVAAEKVLTHTADERHITTTITESQRAWLAQHITSTWRQVAPGEWRGPHPVHGSASGNNCKINLNTGQFCCFRHNTGGSWLTAYAVFKKLLPCENAYPFRRQRNEPYHG